MSMRCSFSRAVEFLRQVLLGRAGMRSGKRLRRIPVIAVLLVVGAPLLAPSAATAAGWMIQRTPRPNRFSQGGLVGVSCQGTACTAVGGYLNKAGTARTLAERWIKGSGWTVQTTINPGPEDATLNGVSCPVATNCKAVGSSGQDTLVERWNGTAWKIQPTPNPTGSTGASMQGVSCTAGGACTAVGSYDNALNERFTLAERWNGTQWRIQSTPNPTGSTSAELRGVSCTANACIAVGSYRDAAGDTLTLAERWNGTRWRIQSTPNPPGTGIELFGVSCSAGDACTAVGRFDVGPGDSGGQALAERWNGTQWTIQSTKATVARLFGVSCRAADVCTAVGFSRSSGIQRTLAERWNGTQWTIQSTPNPTGSTSSELSAASCPGPGACTAVGSFDDSNFPRGQPLAERRG
jgi:hypothetical protein